jgi:hypothetical protein
VLTALGTEQRVCQLPVRERSRASLPHQIKPEYVGSQSQPLDDVTAETWAEVTGTGRHDDRIDFGRS